jgi:hypothetical protein
VGSTDAAARGNVEAYAAMLGVPLPQPAVATLLAAASDAHKPEE